MLEITLFGPSPLGTVQQQDRVGGDCPTTSPVPEIRLRCSLVRSARLSEPTSRYVVPLVSSGRVPSGSASTLLMFDQAQMGTMRKSSHTSSSARMPRIHHLRRLPGGRGFFGAADGLGGPAAGRVGGGWFGSAGVAKRGPSSGRRGGGASYVPPNDFGFSSGGSPWSLTWSVGWSPPWSGPPGPAPIFWVCSAWSSVGRDIIRVASGTPSEGGGGGGGDPSLPEYSQRYSGPSGFLSSAMAVETTGG